jgi:hypothetical protein
LGDPCANLSPKGEEQESGSLAVQAVLQRKPVEVGTGLAQKVYQILPGLVRGCVRQEPGRFANHQQTMVLMDNPGGVKFHAAEIPPD